MQYCKGRAASAQRWFFAIAVAAAGMVAACDSQPTDKRPPEQIWREVCSSCHGLSGEGLPHKLGKQVDMRTPTWQASRTDAELRDIITHGVQGVKRMPAWKKQFGDEQIAGLVRYLREEIPPKPAAAQRPPESAVIPSTN